MNRRLVVVLILTIAGAGATILVPRLHAIERRPTSYYALLESSLAKKGCLDPAWLATHPDGDALFVKVLRPTTLELHVTGGRELQPGVVVIADHGDAAQMGWTHISGAANGLRQTVMLPAEGTYVFIVVDRRTIAGDELAADRGCFNLTVTPRAPLAAEPLRMGWRGTTGEPHLFDASHLPSDMVNVRVTHLTDSGMLRVTTFEDGMMMNTTIIDARATVELTLNARHFAGKLLLEEALNANADEPLRASIERITDAASVEDPEYRMVVR